MCVIGAAHCSIAHLVCQCFVFVTAMYNNQPCIQEYFVTRCCDIMSQFIVGLVHKFLPFGCNVGIPTTLLFKLQYVVVRYVLYTGSGYPQRFPYTSTQISDEWSFVMVRCRRSRCCLYPSVVTLFFLIFEVAMCIRL